MRVNTDKDFATELAHLRDLADAILTHPALTATAAQQLADAPIPTR
jgi:hypothetical protein